MQVTITSWEGAPTSKMLSGFTGFAIVSMRYIPVSLKTRRKVEVSAKPVMLPPSSGFTSIQSPVVGLVSHVMKGVDVGSMIEEKNTRSGSAESPAARRRCLLRNMSDGEASAG